MPYRISVFTSYPADAERRGPTHAATLAAMDPNHKIIFTDCVAFGQLVNKPLCFKGLPNLEYRTCYFPIYKSNLLFYIICKIRQVISRLIFCASGRLDVSLLSLSAISLQKCLEKCLADCYMAHNIDTLLPAYYAAKKNRAKLVFDSMEFHSDMGQSRFDRWIIRSIEKKCLPACDLIISSSKEISGALQEKYHISEPLPICNASPLVLRIPPKSYEVLKLYWKNRTIALGTRGLEDILKAMVFLPRDVELDIQGNISDSEKRKLARVLKALNITKRVRLHPAHEQQDFATSAFPYNVGLCPEPGFCQNFRLTTFNKLFDYFMAGLVVIASDLPGLASIIRESEAGLLFKARDYADLANKILLLYYDRALLQRLSDNARRYAINNANQEREMDKFMVAFQKMKDKNGDGLA